MQELTAPHLQASVAYSTGGHLKLLSKSAATGHIRGTLKLSGFTPNALVTSGTQVGLIGTLNGHDVDAIHSNCAWLSAPASLPTMTSDSTIAFSAKAKFDDVDVPSASVSQINGHTIDKYNLVSPDKRYNVAGSGKKTFKPGSTAKDVTAKTFNGFSLDQFITKDSVQDISGTSTFSSSVTADKISAGTPSSPPTVCKKDLISHCSYDIGSVQAQNGVVADNTIGKGISTKFSTIKINKGLTCHKYQSNILSH